jgi:tol-pal system protein YbgF
MKIIKRYSEQKSLVHVFSALALSALLMAGIAWPSVSAAQSRDVQNLSYNVERLERQLQTLERILYRGDTPAAGSASIETTPPPPALSDLQITQDTLEEQTRRLTGQIEQLEFQIRQLNDRMDRLVADVDFRLRELEGNGIPGQASRGGGAPVAPVAPQRAGLVKVQGEGGAAPHVIGTLTESQLLKANVPAGGGDQTASALATTMAAATSIGVALPEGSVQDRYNYARQFLLRRDFASAEQTFSEFVSVHGDDPLAGNALYWLGETYYVRGDYQTAARTFAEGFQRYPESGKAPDNLLKLGMSLAQLNQRADACITLRKLRVEYPDAPTSVVKRADREIGRLQCG